MDKTVKIGKKGGAKRIASELAKIRKSPISKEVFEIMENFKKNNKQNDKTCFVPDSLKQNMFKI